MERMIVMIVTERYDKNRNKYKKDIETERNVRKYRNISL